MKFHRLLILSVILFSQVSMAAYVEKVKGKKTLIVLDGLSVNQGETVDVIDSRTGKKTAIMKIKTVKDGKAIADIVRGKARVKQEVVSRSSKSSAEAAPSPMPRPMPTTKRTTKKKSSSSSTSGMAFGGLFGVGFDTMEIVIDNGPVETIEKTGMGMSLLAAGDIQFRDWLSLRALAGLEQFKAEGDSAKVGVPTTCRTCTTEITYLSLMGWARFHFTQAFWLGLGAGLQHPMSKKSNALDESTIKTSAVWALGGGFDVDLGSDMYIPIQLEYGLQPKSDSVAISYYSARLGLMLRF